LGKKKARVLTEVDTRTQGGILKKTHPKKKSAENVAQPERRSQGRVSNLSATERERERVGQTAYFTKKLPKTPAIRSQKARS